MAATADLKKQAADAREQLAQLRQQVEMLMQERVPPTLTEAAGRAESAARTASEFTREQAKAVSGRVRRQPLMALLVAVGAGWFIGRVFR